MADIKPGDEVIMPSYTFVSTANAFVLRGGVPVFVDIRPDTLNIDERLIEKAITRKTKAIVPVHYAGVGCEMDAVLKIARRYELLVIEDAAHGVKATYKGRELGTIGDLGALSFHETKNIICGEGGALLVNNPKFLKRAEILWQKGTDRSRFMRGEVDKYTWRDIGSSFLPSELTSAFLYAQLKKAEQITIERKKIWAKYHKNFQEMEDKNLIRRPFIPKMTKHNAHMYFLLFKSPQKRNKFIAFMQSKKINCVFHYSPLDQSPFMRKRAPHRQSCPVSIMISKQIARIPLWHGVSKVQDKIIDAVLKTGNFL